jgi:sugar/nucleoside kinase (ribokinase family)
MSTGRPPTLLVHGAVNPDLVLHVARLPSAGDDLPAHSWSLGYGGGAANAAVALAGWGVDVVVTGLVLGDDPLGEAVVRSLARPHLDLSHLERDRGDRTRFCVVLVTPDGDRTIVATGYGGARWQRVPEPVWERAEAVLVDGYAANGREVVSEARRRSLPAVWLDAPVTDAPLADLVVWSRHEHGEDDLASVVAAGATVALTAGPAPVVVAHPGGGFSVRPPGIEVVDATGAGDVFAAACARGLLLGHGLPRAVAWAAAAGSAAARLGRAAGGPSLLAVERLLDLG